MHALLDANLFGRGGIVSLMLSARTSNTNTRSHLEWTDDDIVHDKRSTTAHTHAHIHGPCTACRCVASVCFRATIGLCGSRTHRRWCMCAFVCVCEWMSVRRSNVSRETGLFTSSCATSWWRFSLPLLVRFADFCCYIVAVRILRFSVLPSINAMHTKKNHTPYAIKLLQPSTSALSHHPSNAASINEFRYMLRATESW